MAGRGFLQKTFIRVVFSQPDKRIIASVVRCGAKMLLDWNGCDGASSREGHNMPISDSGPVGGGPSTAGLSRSPSVMVWVPDVVLISI